jgi:hypothetical protein
MQGCGTTLTRWRKLPGFEDHMRRAQETYADPSALDTLRELLTSNSEHIRLQAARALLLQGAFSFGLSPSFNTRSLEIDEFAHGRTPARAEVSARPAARR